MTPPPILGQDDLIECLRWAAFKMYGAGEHETFASDAITMAIYHIEDLRHDLERQMTIANEHVNEVERWRVRAEHYSDQWSAVGTKGQAIIDELCAENKQIREALEDLLHAVCGEKGFAEAVRRDSGRIYPWPALELAEAKARAALQEQSE